MLERHHGHDPLVLIAVVTGRTGSGNALCRILLRHFRVVLAKMLSMVENDSRTPLERIVLEFRVMAVEAVELHQVTRAALLVGNSVQIETCALMLLVAGGAIETTCDYIMHWECDALRASR